MNYFVGMFKISLRIFPGLKCSYSIKILLEIMELENISLYK